MMGLSSESDAKQINAELQEITKRDAEVRSTDVKLRSGLEMLGIFREAKHVANFYPFGENARITLVGKSTIEHEEVLIDPANPASGKRKRQFSFSGIEEKFGQALLFDCAGPFVDKNNPQTSRTEGITYIDKEWQVNVPNEKNFWKGLCLLVDDQINDLAHLDTLMKKPNYTHAEAAAVVRRRLQELELEGHTVECFTTVPIIHSGKPDGKIIQQVEADFLGGNFPRRALIKRLTAGSPKPSYGLVDFPDSVTVIEMADTLRRIKGDLSGSLDYGASSAFYLDTGNNLDGSIFTAAGERLRLGRRVLSKEGNYKSLDRSAIVNVNELSQGTSKARLVGHSGAK